MSRRQYGPRGKHPIPAHECSELLYQVATKSTPLTSIDLAVVQRCVYGAADITFSPNGKHRTALHCCIRDGNLEVLKVLLQTERDVDFTVRYSKKTDAWTPLQWLAGCDSPADVKVAMLTAILHRLATHPNDTVDWSIKTRDGLDFLHLAAREGVLSDLYPLVKDQPYYVNAVKPIVLGCPTKDDDWAKLSEADRQAFRLSEAGHTYRLFHELCFSSSVDLALVRTSVSALADITVVPVGEHRSALHLSIIKSNTEVLRLLLETQRDVDFTVTSMERTLHNPFHNVAACDSPADVKAAMLTAILGRLATHPNDRVDWSAKTIDGLDFLSLAAREGVLSDLYPLVKDQPYYVNAVKPLELAYLPMDDDWAKLSPEDHQCFHTTEEGYSYRLFHTLANLASFSTPIDFTVVRQCLSRAADITFCPPGGAYPALHSSISYGHVELVKLLLETKSDVDFTVRDSSGNGWSPLHYVVISSDAADDGKVAMLTAILHRLATHPNDIVDWSVKSWDGLDFLSLAAREGVLSDLYPLVKDQPYYVNAAKPIALGCPPKDDDWAKLCEEDQMSIEVGEKGYSYHLYKVIESFAYGALPDLPAVDHCVTRSADIMFRPEGEMQPSFHWCIHMTHVHAVNLLLETPHDVDFTVTDSLCSYGWTPLQWVAGTAGSGDEKAAMLTAILHRLATHPNDIVDWSVKSWDGLDFLSLAAREGVLSDLYPLVKDQPYYVNAAKPLVLARVPKDDDWAKLSEADQSAFQR